MAKRRSATPRMKRDWERVCRESDARAAKVEPQRLRIRRCEGNKSAWCLVALRADGTEIGSFGGSTTALSIDAVLERAGHLAPKHGQTVELVWTVNPDAKDGAEIWQPCAQCTDPMDCGSWKSCMNQRAPVRPTQKGVCISPTCDCMTRLGHCEVTGRLPI